MLRKLRTQTGQAITGELVLTFAIVVAALITMTTYVRRTYQGRIFDADIQMEVAAGCALGLKNLQTEYEPYYVETRTRKGQRLSTVETRPAGAFSRSVQDFTGQATVSNQAPPYKAAGWN